MDTKVFGGYYNGSVCFIDTINLLLIDKIRSFVDDEYNCTNLCYRGFLGRRTEEQISKEKNILLAKKFNGHVFTFQWTREFAEYMSFFDYTNEQKGECFSFTIKHLNWSPLSVFNLFPTIL